jgi:hypothetical protein
MRSRWLLLPLTVVVAIAVSGAAFGAANVRVTRDATASSYLRDDGTADATTAACSTGRRSQNEPTVAVNPHNPQVVTAGANDYCAQIVNGEVWAGYYRSVDGGANWQNSLVPGYPADASAAGVASPTHGTCGAAGDPTQAFDRDGRLFYAFICFNRAKPVNGGVFVARYTGDGGTYDRTVLVKRGTPSGQFGAGLFQDKINLTVDQTTGQFAGNVYMAWSQYNSFAPNNAVLFARSTDHGLIFSRPIRVTPVAHGTASFADLAVGPDGAVYLAFLTYPSASNPSSDVWLSKSTNGGASFGSAAHVASIVLTDSNQFSGNGSESCGDGPFACPSGLTFSRFFSAPAVAADASGVHVVWGAELPSGQSKIFVRNSPTASPGRPWPPPWTRWAWATSGPPISPPPPGCSAWSSTTPAPTRPTRPPCHPATPPAGRTPGTWSTPSWPSPPAAAPVGARPKSRPQAATSAGRPTAPDGLGSGVTTSTSRQWAPPS